MPTPAELSAELAYLGMPDAQFGVAPCLTGSHAADFHLRWQNRGACVPIDEDDIKLEISEFAQKILSPLIRVLGQR